MRNVGSIFGVLNRDTANVPLLIQVQECVLVEVSGFRNVSGTELDIQRIGVSKVFNLHALQVYQSSRSRQVPDEKPSQKRPTKTDTH